MTTQKYNEFLLESDGDNLVPITVWFSIQNGGDGSAYPDWYLTEEEAEHDQETMDEGWGESCTGMVETYEGSNVHKKALRNSTRRRR